MLPVIALLGLFSAKLHQNENFFIKCKFSVFSLLVLCSSALFVGLAYSGWPTQNSSFIKDLSLLGLSLLLLIYLAQENSVRRIHYFILFIQFQFVTILVLLVLACDRFIWLIDQYGLRSAFQFRLWISLIHPNALGIYLVCLLPFSLFFRSQLFLSRFQKHFFTFVIFLLVIMTYSRSAWICTALLLITLIIREFKNDRFKHYIKARTVWYLVLSTFLFLNIASLAFYKIINFDMIHHRIALWNVAIKGILKKPIFGYGLAKHNAAAQFITNPFDSNYMFLSRWFNWDHLGKHFHNIFIETTWVSGITGLTILIFFVVFALHRINDKKTNNNPLNFSFRLSFLILLVFSLSDFVFYYPVFSTIFVTALSKITGNNQKFNHLFIFRCPIRLLNYILIFALFMSETFCILLPSLGKHWERRGDAKLVEDETWAIPAFKKALYYRPYDREITQKLSTVYNKKRMFSYSKKLYTRLLDSCDLNSAAVGITGWLISDNTRRCKHFIRAIAKDPTGLGYKEYYSDTALSFLIENDIVNAKKYLKSALYYDPDGFFKLMEALCNESDIVQITSVNLQTFLTAVYDYPNFPLQEFSSIGISINSLFDEIETELDEEEQSPWLKGKRIALTKVQMLVGNIEATVSMMNKWQIPYNQLIQKSGKVETFKPDDPQYLLLQGEKTLNQGKLDEARVIFEKIISIGYSDARLKFDLGEIYFQKKDWASALKYFIESRELDPAFSESYLKIGQIYSYQNKMDLAEMNLTKAYKLNPFSSNACFELGNLMLNKEHYQTALDFFNKAIKLDPDNTTFLKSRHDCQKIIFDNRRKYRTDER